jgi:signal peptidase I
MEGNNGNAPQENRLSEEAERQISEIEEKVAKKKPNFWKEVKEWVVALVVALLVVFVIQTFLFRIIRVDGHSMDTTLADGERLFVTVTDVKFGSVQRDSVVICHYPNRYNKFLGLIPMQTYFVKRVVAVPGDTIYCENGVTHVTYEQDGETVDKALDERFAQFYVYGSPFDYEPYVLGEDEYFVVGDNRYNSHDSRDWNDSDPSYDVGPISKSMIVGHVRQVIWPLGSIRPVS